MSVRVVLRYVSTLLSFLAERAQCTRQHFAARLMFKWSQTMVMLCEDSFHYTREDFIYMSNVERNAVKTLSSTVSRYRPCYVVCPKRESRYMRRPPGPFTIHLTRL